MLKSALFVLGFLSFVFFPERFASASQLVADVLRAQPIQYVAKTLVDALGEAMNALGEAMNGSTDVLDLLVTVIAEVQGAIVCVSIVCVTRITEVGSVALRPLANLLVDAFSYLNPARALFAILFGGFVALTIYAGTRRRS